MEQTMLRQEIVATTLYGFKHQAHILAILVTQLPLFTTIRVMQFFLSLMLIQVTQVAKLPFLSKVVAILRGT